MENLEGWVSPFAARHPNRPSRSLPTRKRISRVGRRKDMMKTGVVIILAIAALAAFGSTALAQPRLPECDLNRTGSISECVKSPVFSVAGDVAKYVVISAGNLRVDGGDCCISGNSWTIKLFFPGRDDPIKENTTATTGIGTGCNPLPTSGYTGQIQHPAVVSIVTVEPAATPNGFPSQMYVRFQALGPLTVVQVEGGDGCGL
jgi:hypothetical protein